MNQDGWRSLLQLLLDPTLLGLVLSAVGIVASVLSTVLSTVVGVSIALWVQRRDFERRRDELLETTRQQQHEQAAAARREMADRLIEFVVQLEENAIADGRAPGDDTMQRAMDSYFNRLKYFEPDSMSVFSAVYTTWLVMQSFRGLPLSGRAAKTHPYASILQTNLARWAAGEITAASFPPVVPPRQ